MPKSNWKGIISFGLVSIPIILYPSENKMTKISFHQIDKKDNARIKYQRINTQTGKIVPWEDIARGYEYDKEHSIPVPDKVLKKVAGENARTINIENFIDKKYLNIIAIQNTYYLFPEKKGEKAYVILREALKQSGKMGIAKIIISTKEYLSTILPYGDAIILCLLKYDNEIKKLSEFDLPNKNMSAYKITKKELEVAKQLILSMSTKWNPSHYQDEYQQAIQQWIEKSVKKLPSPTMKSRVPETIKMSADLIDLLKKSLAGATKGKQKTKPKKAITKRSPHYAMKH